MKSMNSPIVSWPAITSRPPKRSTAAIPSEGRKRRPGRKYASTDGLPHRLVANRLGPPEEARAHVVLAAESLHHLDPDDGLVGRLGEVALLRLDEPRDREELVGEEPGQNGDRRHRERGEEREPRVHDREHDRRAR